MLKQVYANRHKRETARKPYKAEPTEFLKKLLQTKSQLSLRAADVITPPGECSNKDGDTDDNPRKTHECETDSDARAYTGACSCSIGAGSPEDSPQAAEQTDIDNVCAGGGAPSTADSMNCHL